MRGRKKGVKVLIVDDEENIREFMSYMLKERGFITENAKNGKEALDKVAADKPNIILLDIAMPEMDGLETCERLRKNPDTRDIPIIFLSAQGHISAISNGISAATIEYIEKPCDIEYLIQRIKDLATNKTN